MPHPRADPLWQMPHYGKGKGEEIPEKCPERGISGLGIDRAITVVDALVFFSFTEKVKMPSERQVKIKHRKLVFRAFLLSTQIRNLENEVKNLTATSHATVEQPL